MTSSENEREDITEGGIETWRETVARNRLERRQRGSNYEPRHRREPAGHGWQTITGHTYDSTTERPRRPSSGAGRRQTPWREAHARHGGSEPDLSTRHATRRCRDVK